jgi:hypothetical protein
MLTIYGSLFGLRCKFMNELEFSFEQRILDLKFKHYLTWKKEEGKKSNVSCSNPSVGINP